jgi:hypothetical protein
MLPLLAFLPAILTGVLIAHLLWPERSFWGLALKLFLGIGLGMGVRSLIYFLYLMLLPARHLYLWIELALLLLLIGLTIRMEREAGKVGWSQFSFPTTTKLQRMAVVVAAVVVGLSLLSSANYLLRRRQGDWDAWMMYNRAARFMYNDQANWLDSFSPQMDPIFHPDYPLLLAGDIVAGWDILGRESATIPMLQSALFSVACLGLFATALASVRSVGQAMLGVTILWGLPVFVNEGGRQMADVPMAFFVLATAVLLAFYALRAHPGLLALTGLATGLGAWTKNEGTVLVAGAGLAFLYLAARGRRWRTLLPFVAGLAFPLVVLVFFRLFIAPSGDMLGAMARGSLAQVVDPSRHSAILRHLGSELLGFGAWGVPGLGLGILPIMLLYFALFRRRLASDWAQALQAAVIILGVQVLGYYAAYLISPYELSWHLTYSSSRIVLQVFPLLAFIMLSATTNLETAFRETPLPSSE